MITEMKGATGRFNDYPGLGLMERLNKKRPHEEASFVVPSSKKFLPPADGLVCGQDHIYQGIIIRAVDIKIKAVAFSSFGNDFNQFFRGLRRR